jgi:hypothetical protein
MGKMLGVTDSSFCQQTIPIEYTAALVTQKVWLSPHSIRQMRVVDIRGVTRVAGSEGSAVTVSIYKAASGVAVASGTLLHTGTFDVKGTADTNQVLTLAANPDTLTINPGDSIGYALTGTATAAVGVFQITLEPV